MRRKLSEAINEVFDEMDALSDEEFYEELDKYKNDDLAKALLYACGSHMDEEHRCPVCKTLFIEGDNVDIIIDESNPGKVIISTTTETEISNEDFLKGIEDAGRKIVDSQEEG